MRVIFNGYAIAGIGGPQRYAAPFQAALRARGIEAIGIAFRSSEGSASGPKIINAPHGPMHHYFLDPAIEALMQDPEPGRPHGVAEASVRVAGILAAERPDALVLNGFSPENAYLAEAAAALGVPYLFSHHGFWFAEISKTAPLASQERRRCMEKEAIRAARTNIYLNAWSIRRAREAYPDVIRHDDAVIPLPFNPVFEHPAPPIFPSSDKPVIGFVARWDPIKNVSLVRAFADSARDLRVVSPMRITGRPSLANEARSFRRAVKVMQPLSQESLAGFYRSCALLILPSRFDVSPTVVMEAALQGRGTIISDDVGWVQDYERLGMEDWIVRDPTPQGLEAAVRRCLGKPVPHAFVEEILERHQPDRVFDAFASLLTSL